MIHFTPDDLIPFETAGMEHAQHLQHMQQELEKQTDLSPQNDQTNALLSSLVGYLSHIENCGYCSYMPHAMLAEASEKLPVLCGTAECLMEKFWARYFLTKKGLNALTLREFWYYRNYQALWELEHQLIQQNSTEKTVVFLGSGALPFTAIFAAWQGYRVICVDYDAEACALSSGLIKALGLNGQMSVIQGSAQTFPFSPEHFVICASLIEGKEELYKNLHSAGVEHFAVRDAEGAYRYLYKPSQAPLTSMYTETGKTTPNEQCINTLRLYQKV